ncbi:MAG: hypothetical protein J4203_02375 [Candidatus Diapherotrites archaeon]|uniref:Transcription factor E n=1 Tax=Candidatus Iainarchaeum sp. TaxID=3101447 RepID=A0A8T4L9T2_9ARCH|nr:hypothetical protein [Candidatus Diapherotrites archaeon]
MKKVGGDYAPELVKICENRGKPITDEEIGKKLPLKITEIRTILNRLHFRGIAAYQKTRNTNTGWYSYTWEISAGRVAELILDEQAQEITKLEKRSEFEEGHAIFNCKRKCSDFPFEVAAEYQFRCPECGETMNPADAKKRTKNLKQHVGALKDEVALLKKYKERYI